MPAEHESELLLHDGVLAADEDLVDKLRVVELQREPQRLRVLVELAEDLQRGLQQRRVLRLWDVRNAARQVQAHAVVRGLEGGKVIKYSLGSAVFQLSEVK